MVDQLESYLVEMMGLKKAELKVMKVVAMSALHQVYNKAAQLERLKVNAMVFWMGVSWVSLLAVQWALELVAQQDNLMVSEMVDQQDELLVEGREFEPALMKGGGTVAQLVEYLANFWVFEQENRVVASTGDLME